MSEEYIVGELFTSEDATPAPEDTHIEAAPEETPKQNSQEYNWKEARQTMSHMNARLEQLQRERDELAKQIAPKPVEIKLAEDEWVTGKEIYSYTENVIKEKVAEQVNRILAQQEEAKAADLLKQKFPDFDKVVNEKTVEKLLAENPELLETIKSSATGTYQKGASLYKVLKGYLPEMEQTAENKKKLDENYKKPRAFDALGRSPLVAQIDANDRILTKDTQDALLQEMIRCSQG